LDDFDDKESNIEVDIKNKDDLPGSELGQEENLKLIEKDFPQDEKSEQ
jgi:hypothetical protein